MKNTAIILCILLLISGIIYTKLFIGSESYSSPAKHPIYNTHFHTIDLPLVKIKKGFFNYTFYVKNSWQNDAAELSFQIDYRSGTVTFNDTDTWNKAIRGLNITNAKSIKNQYMYSGPEHSYFKDLRPGFASFVLIEENAMIRELIILKSDAVVRIDL